MIQIDAVAFGTVAAKEVASASPEVTAAAHVDVQKGVLIVANMKTPKSEKIDLVHMGRWPQGVFHRFDYAFWFNNLKANVKQRIAAYQGKQD